MDKRNELDSINISEKQLLEVLQYAYQKGESSLQYTTAELIAEMTNQLNAKKNDALR